MIESNITVSFIMFDSNYQDEKGKLIFDNSIKCYEARVISGAQAGVFNYIKMTVQIDFMSILVSTLTSLDQTGGKNIFALHLLCLCHLLQILGVLLYM